MNDVKIKKAKIKDNLFLEVEYSEWLEGHSKKETKLSCTVPVHDDLKHAFSILHRHLAILCDEVKAPKRGDFETVEYPEFGVRSFSVGGSDDNEGVTVSGWKDGKFGVVNLNTPFTKYTSEDYPFISELSQDVDRCEYEVIQYLFHGKKAPDQQLKIEFPDEDLIEA